MAHTEIVLYFGLEDGRNADALVAGKALVAWVELAREAAEATNAGQAFAVELLSAERGSLRFTQVLRSLDNVVASVRAGSSEYPNLSAAGLALGIAVVIGALLHKPCR